jgi:hypothetical protein
MARLTFPSRLELNSPLAALSLTYNLRKWKPIAVRKEGGNRTRPYWG